MGDERRPFIAVESGVPARSRALPGTRRGHRGGDRPARDDADLAALLAGRRRAAASRQSGGELGGGIAATGNYPGKARTPDELRARRRPRRCR